VSIPTRGPALLVRCALSKENFSYKHLPVLFPLLPSCYKRDGFEPSALLQQLRFKVTLRQLPSSALALFSSFPRKAIPFSPPSDYPLPPACRQLSNLTPFPPCQKLPLPCSAKAPFPGLTFRSLRILFHGFHFPSHFFRNATSFFDHDTPPS